LASSKHASGGKCYPSCEHTVIDAEMKTIMKLKYEGGQSLSVITHGLAFVVSAVNIMKDNM
jgi:hypothetical protein